MVNKTLTFQRIGSQGFSSVLSIHSVSGSQLPISPGREQTAAGPCSEEGPATRSVL